MKFSEVICKNEQDIIDLMVSIDFLKEISEETYIYNGESINSYNFLQFLAFKLNDDKIFYRNLLSIGINSSDENILNHQDSLENTLLHYLALNNEDELIELLLTKKIGLKRNSSGKLPQTKNEDLNQRIQNLLIMKYKPEFYKEIDKNSIIKQDKLGDYNVYHLDTHVSEKNENNKIVQLKSNSFPGRLYIILCKLTDVVNTDPKIKTISVCVKKNDYIVFSESYEINNVVQMNDTLFIPIERSDEDLEFKIYACVWETDKTVKNVKIGYFYYSFDDEEMKNTHSTLYDKQMSIHYYTNIYRMFKSIFYTPITIANNLSLKMCYISNEELKYVEAPTPNSTASLYNWLVVKQISEYIWFRGYCHVKTNQDTLWKRRMILWQGIHLVVYNEYSGAKVSNFIMTSINKKRVIINNENNSIQLTLHNSDNLQLCFDFKEVFTKFEQGLRTFLAF